MNQDQRVVEGLIEQVCSAWRSRGAGGMVEAHPAWHDLAEEGRREAFESTVELRQMESALDPLGLSSTGRAVLERLGH